MDSVGSNIFAHPYEREREREVGVGRNSVNRAYIDIVTELL
jgi:hypothetical protein